MAVGFGRSLTPDAVRERWAAVKESQQLPQFDEAAFIAYVKGTKIDAGGELEITLHVALAQKHNALPITNAPGTMLLFEVYPKPRYRDPE